MEIQMIKYIKNFISNTEFIKDALNDAYEMGIENERTGNLAYIKRYEQLRLQETEDLANKKLNNLLSIVNNDLIIKYDKTTGIIYIGNERIEEGRLTNLRSEAELISKTDLWKLLNETPKELAHRAMFINSITVEDILKGKAMLYTLDTQNNIINLLKSFKPKISPKK